MNNFVKGIIVIMAVLLCLCAPVAASDATGIVFQAHVQNKGWIASVTNNQVAGTEGQSLNMEAFQANLPSGTNGIRYCAHVSTEGWQDWAENGEVAGTIGESKPIEAVKIELTGEAAATYDVYYRVHDANLGWLDWASNGAAAGTTGLTLPVQAIQIDVVAKGAGISDSTETPFIDGSGFNSQDLSYNVHVATVGWQDMHSSGQIAGSIGEEKSLEAITINSPSVTAVEGSSINYQTHIQNSGWTDIASNGAESGTTGLGLEMQALKVSLSGPVAAAEDIYYRAHVQNYGWLDWAKNGETAGTEGLGLRMEAVEIVMQPKGVAAPGSTADPSITVDSLQAGENLTMQAAIENLGWTDPVGNGGVVGLEGQNLGIEALSIELPDTSDGSLISYNLNIEDIGWQGDHLNGSIAGTEGQNKQAEAVAISLNGRASEEYDIYYQACVEGIGWLGWTCNGNWAGTSGGNKKMEALRVQMSLKGSPPAQIGESYRVIEPEPVVPQAPDTQVTSDSGNWITADQVNQFDLICAIVQHEGGATYDGALAVMSCVMNRCDSGRWGGTDPVSILTAPGQFASYLDGYYKQYLGRSAVEVQQAVLDCINGKRSHPYESFRSYPTSGSVNICGNWYF